MTLSSFNTISEGHYSWIQIFRLFNFCNICHHVCVLRLSGDVNIGHVRAASSQIRNWRTHVALPESLIVCSKALIGAWNFTSLSQKLFLFFKCKWKPHWNDKSLHFIFLWIKAHVTLVIEISVTTVVPVRRCSNHKKNVLRCVEYARLSVYSIIKNATEKMKQRHSIESSLGSASTPHILI